MTEFCGLLWSFSYIFDAKYNVIWSGVIGALIAASISFYSVRASNKGSLDRLLAQHKHDVAEARAQREHDVAEANTQREHDTAQKNEERKASFRRTVYLEAVNDVISAAHHLSGLPHYEKLHTNPLGPLEPFNKSCAKVWLVAEPKAAHSFLNLKRELVVMSTKCVKRAAIVAAAKTELNENLNASRSASEEITFLTESIKGERDGNKLYAADSRRRALEQQINAARNAEGELRRAYFEKFADYVRWIQSENARMLEILIKTVSALREEIHLDADELAFAIQLREEAALGRALVEDLVNEVAA